jgi:hypothetical protein
MSILFERTNWAANSDQAGSRAGKSVSLNHSANPSTNESFPSFLSKRPSPNVATQRALRILFQLHLYLSLSLSLSLSAVMIDSRGCNLLLGFFFYANAYPLFSSLSTLLTHCRSRSIPLFAYIERRIELSPTAAARQTARTHDNQFKFCMKESSEDFPSGERERERERDHFPHFFSF